VTTTVGDPLNTRQRRLLQDAAIGAATHGDWEAAVDANQQLLELGGDVDVYNRLGKALSELSRYAEALEAYEHALESDSTNRIAQRNVDRLRVLADQQKAREKRQHRDGKPDKAPAALFIEEMGKTGHARLINIAPPKARASLSAGDAVELEADGSRLVAKIGVTEIGQVEPRVAGRLTKLIDGGNRYEAALTVIHEDEVRLIIREVFAHPANFGKVSFPGATARGGDIRPYLKGALRYDEDEETEELEEESEEVEELDTSLPEYSGEPELEEELIEEP
jgi:tetratricopeptide (TPR) repeat protein